MLTVTNAEYVGGLSLKLRFSDGVERIVDFTGFIKSHPHIQYQQYMKPENFRMFTIDNGNVVWGQDWDLIFPVEDLYNGVL